MSIAFTLAAFLVLAPTDDEPPTISWHADLAAAEAAATASRRPMLVVFR